MRREGRKGGSGGRGREEKKGRREGRGRREDGGGEAGLAGLGCLPGALTPLGAQLPSWPRSGFRAECRQIE